MSRRHVVIAVIGCFATLLLALLDQNVVSAVSWTMARELDPVHGVDQLPWLLTAYTLADCVVLPLYGKLTDAYGAKRVYLSALGIFLTGSVLCGMAQSMPELIAFRAGSTARRAERHRRRDAHRLHRGCLRHGLSGRPVAVPPGTSARNCRC